MATKILKPKTLVTNNANFAASGAATIPIACDPLDEVHDDDTSYAARGSGGTNTTLGLQHDFGFSGRMSAISSVKVVGRIRRTDGSDGNYNLKIILGGSSSTSGALAFGLTYVTREFDAARPGGGNWTEDDLRDPSLEFQLILPSNPPTTRSTSLYLKVDFTPLAVTVEQHRHVASQVLLSRLKQLFVDGAFPLKFMDLDVLEDFMLSHRLFPTPDGKGRGLKRWERLLLYALRADVDPMTNLVRVSALDLRSYRRLLWDVGQSKISTLKTDIADGIARLATGGKREFSRASKAYGVDISGVAIVEFGIDEEAITRDGMLLEGASTTYVWNGVFKDGFTNWTKVNDGVDGVAITLDTGKLLFEGTPEIGTRQSVKILTGATTEGGLEQITGTTIGASTKNTLSVWHDDDSGAQLALRVKNETTGNWLQSNGTWGASEVNAALFTETSTKKRDFLHFTTEATASTLRLRAVGATTGAKISHVYHIQLEAGPPSSEMVSGSADKTRSISKFKFSNDFGKRILNTPHGYFACELIPNFDDAELAANEEKMIARAEYDVNNIEEFFYKQGSGFSFRRTVGASAVTASKSTPLAVRGTAYQVTFRWTGTEGEFGVSDFTISTFVDGVKGTDAVAGGAPTPPSTMSAWMGQDGSDAKAFDGIVRRVRIGPFVPNDAEMARLL